jgi:hypothetical protein
MVIGGSGEELANRRLLGRCRHQNHKFGGVMLSMKITGFDKLQRELKEAQDAFESLEGTIATLRFNPEDAASVQEAIRQIETAVDAKTARFSANPLVRSVVDKLKSTYRQKLVERARPHI